MHIGHIIIDDFLPMPLTMVIMLLTMRLLPLLVKPKGALPESATPHNLPLSNVAYIVASSVAGVLSAVVIYLLCKHNPWAKAFQAGWLFSSLYLVIAWVGWKNVDEQARANMKKILLVICLPFSVTIWMSAAVISLFKCLYRW